MTDEPSPRDGTSRKVDAESDEGRRIRAAFSSGKTYWEELPHEWVLKHVGADQATFKRIEKHALKHVVWDRHEIKWQENEKSGEKEELGWYYIVFTMREKKYFFKFVLRPDDESPDVWVIRFHHPLN